MARIEGRPNPGFWLRIIYWVARRRFGSVPEPLRITAHNRWVLAASLGYEVFAPKAHALDGRAKDLVNLLVAMRVGCPFCVDIGSAIARGNGVDAADVGELHEWRASRRFSERERLMFEYAEAMTRAPAVVPEELFRALEAAVGKAGMVELSAVIAWENYRARFNLAFDAEAQGYADGAFCRVPPRPALPAANG
jgi:AhpD family alkylhydroperoxidase